MNEHLLGLRTADNNDEPGHYECLLNPNDTIFDPGDSMLIDILFTGYGKIKGAKILIRNSLPIFEVEHSKIEYGFGKNDSIIGWVNRPELKLEDSTLATIFEFDSGGIRNEAHNSSDFFCDLLPGTGRNRLFTEVGIQGGAPLSIKLKLSEKAKSGKHNISFAFTYFNGVEWKGNMYNYDFTVRSFYERHERQIFIWGFLFAAISTIATILQLIL